MISRIAICNDALAEIKASTIQTIEEETLQGRECRRHFQNIVDEMLEGGPVGSHDWSFANRRAALAQLADNDREAEWTNVYQLPSDCATPIRVLPDLSTLGLGVPVGWLSQPYSETWGLFLPTYEQSFIVEDGKLYTNTENATLEYGINQIEVSRLSQMVRRAISKDLAARLARSVKGDQDLAKGLFAEAELLWERAVADDLNRHPRRTNEYESEAMIARSGACHFA